MQRNNRRPDDVARSMRGAIEHMIEIHDTRDLTPLIHSDQTMHQLKQKMQHLDLAKQQRDNEIRSMDMSSSSSIDSVDESIELLSHPSLIIKKNRHSLIELHRKHSPKSLVFASNQSNTVIVAPIMFYGVKAIASVIYGPIWSVIQFIWRNLLYKQHRR